MVSAELDNGMGSELVVSVSGGFEDKGEENTSSRISASILIRGTVVALECSSFTEVQIGG